MSNMQYEQTNFGSDVQILKRKPFEGIAITIDFTGVVGDVVKAGSVITNEGKAVTTVTSSTKVAGILLHDVAKTRPQGTALKKAYINTAVAEAHAGVTYDANVKDALPMVVFE